MALSICFRKCIDKLQMPCVHGAALSIVGSCLDDAAGFYVAHGRLAEEAAVLAIELAGAFVADFEGGAGGIEAVVEHAFARYMQAKLLLVLQRAHRSQRSKLMVQRRYAHARHGGKLFNTQRLAVVGPQPLDSLGGTMALLSQGGDGAEMFALRTAQQSINDFALDEAAENGNVFRRVHKIDEPGTCVEQFEGCDTDGHAACVGGVVALMNLLLGENYAHRRHLEFENQPQERLLFCCSDDLADNGKIHRSQKEVRPIANVDCLAHVDALLSLQKDNQAGFVGRRGAGSRDRTTVEAKARYSSACVPFLQGTIGNLASQLSAHFNYALI